MDHFMDYGRYFGYPECCIKDFIKRVGIFRSTKGLKMEKRKLHGTGYVPCPECNKLDKKTLIETIKKNRAHPQPFPEDGKRRVQ